MNILRSLLARLFNSFRSRALERDMDAEMRAHLERETQANIARGLSPDEAGYAARRSFGGLDQLKERERDARSFVWLQQTRQDLRFGVRQMLKQPGFSLVAVLTLALGLGANITIFSIISFFFFKPLEVKDADRLVVMARQGANMDMALPLSWRDFEDFRDQVSEFGETLALSFRPVNLSRPG